ncbi:hypothetical protein Q0590_14195 [Rhodocytophaga aerolata]|uniref:Uncharacterized protein n=1 Tax=Rhodocytophaga aerolata TaxID=455078 RepID=A0ABT8R9Q0_9BACT|nr:hypothetical protein [Rhodocytophaga aerolata]MDO1447415.1 hypothetical protein [Rhodocytophaga aerolata]
MSTALLNSQSSAYPDKRAVILGLIERQILEFRCGILIWSHKPRYQINVLSESAILLLMGFEDNDRQGELYGYFRGLMEQTLALEINPSQHDQAKLQAEEVYEALLARKESLTGIYNQERTMISKFSNQ